MPSDSKSTPRTPAPAGVLLSPHVSAPGSRYFFLNPGPHRSARLLALGGLEHCNPDYLIDRPGFAYHVIEFVVEGSGWVRFGGGGAEHPIAPGSVFVCEKNIRCTMRTDPARPLVKYFLCLTGRAPLTRLRRAGLPANRVRALTAQGEIRSVLEDLIREGRRPGRRAADICNVLFDLLCLKIADTLVPATRRTKRPGAAARATTRTPRETFLRCKAIIDERAEHLASLAEIATEACLDASNVCRLFRRYQGISPYQYLLRRKMNIAAELLVDGGTLVKEAANRVGFPDALHFSRVFSAVHGVPPSQLQMRNS